MSKILDAVSAAVEHLPKDRGGRSALAQEVKSIRLNLGLNQREFAERFGFTLANIQTWESSKNVKPDTASRMLLDMIKADHEGAAKLVRKAQMMRLQAADNYQKELA